MAGGMERGRAAGPLPKRVLYYNTQLAIRESGDGLPNCSGAQVARNCSKDFPSARASLIQAGWRPRPLHVTSEFSG